MTFKVSARKVALMILPQATLVEWEDCGILTIRSGVRAVRDFFDFFLILDLDIGSSNFGPPGVSSSTS